MGKPLAAEFRYHLGITNKLIAPSHSYIMNDHAISRVDSVKYLGLTINQRLNWNQHCDNLCKKANGSLNLLRRILSDCSVDVNSRAYTTIARPQLEYASCAWNPNTKHHIDKIEMVQHRAARSVFHDYSRTSRVTPMISQL